MRIVHGRVSFWCLAGFYLGTPWLNIFICDLFSIMNNVNFASYADDNYVAGNVIKVIESLKEAPDEFFCWLEKNNQILTSAI